MKHTRTKIVCTIGPACEDEKILEKMARSGMTVARLNFSHGTYDNHAELIARLRLLEKKIGEPIAILQDLQGPKIRVGVLPEKGLELKTGAEVIFDTSKKHYADGAIPVDFATLHTHLKPKDRILLSDGTIETQVVSVSGTAIRARVAVGGTIASHKGINVPDSDIGAVRAMTDKDVADARFGADHGVDMIALSFVKDANDILDARYLLADHEKKEGRQSDAPIRIIAKIERRDAVENIAEILDAADGIMVARGDLGVEVPAAEVPLIQKRLLDMARAAGKPAIVATQMLDSMQDNPRPTRAEVSDVANAVIDHADALMLSNETATGKYPAEAVSVMAEIIRDTEASRYDDVSDTMEKPKKSDPVDDIVGTLSRTLAERVKAKAIVAASISGDTGRMISRHRPELPIVVGTQSVRVLRQLNLSWGILPFLLPPCRSIEELVARSMAHLKERRIVSPGDEMVVVAGEPVGESGHVNVLEVRQVI